MIMTIFVLSLQICQHTSSIGLDGTSNESTSCRWQVQNEYSQSEKTCELMGKPQVGRIVYSNIVYPDGQEPHITAYRCDKITVQP